MDNSLSARSGSVRLITARPTLERERLAIERYLASTLTDDDRAAMAYGRGYRHNSWDPSIPRAPAYDPASLCSRHNQAYCLACDRSPHPRHEQRWTTEIDSSVDRIVGPRLSALIDVALATLAWKPRLILELHCRLNLSWRMVEAWEPPFGGQPLDYSRSRAWELHDESLTRIAELVWDDAGTPRYAPH